MKRAPHTAGLVPFHILLMAMACALFVATGYGVPLARGRQFAELHLKNGTVLHDVTVVAVGATTLVARWDGGQGSILIKLLPDELRADIVPVAPAVTSPTPPPAAPAALDPKLASAELPTEIKLTNGFIMHKSAVTRWEASSVLISYQGGIVSVRFKNISPEQRVIFEARKDEALARQAKEDSNNKAGQDTAAHDEQDRQATEARDREAAEKREDDIKNGISFHYLVKGMTKEQVKLAFGGPADDHGDLFFYASRGHDKYGNAADRTLVFKDGLLDSWKDQRDGEPDGAVSH